MSTTTATFPDKTEALASAVRIAAWVAVDNVVPREALCASDVPASVDQITSQRLTAILCKAHQSAAVVGLTISDRSAGTSGRAALALELNDAAPAASVPSRLFTKSTLTFAQRVLLGLSGGLLGETGFYGVKQRSQIAIERYSHLVPAAIRDRTDKLCEALATSLDINSAMPQTFLHGDCHIGQTYLTRDNRVGYSEWQCVMRGGWAFDVSYTLASALTIEDRRRWKRKLISHYLDRLHAAGGPPHTYLRGKTVRREPRRPKRATMASCQQPAARRIFDPYARQAKFAFLAKERCSGSEGLSTFGRSAPCCPVTRSTEQ